MISKLDLKPKGQGHSKKKPKDNNPGNKTLPPLKNGAVIPLVTDVQLICLFTITVVGQQK